MGALDFLGSHLCDRLVAEGHHVLCLDDLSTGRRENLVQLRNEPRFELIECDVIAPLEALVRLMECEPDPGPVNLGNPEELTVSELAELVRSSTGSSSRLEHRPLPSDDPVRRRPDISKARQLLGWWPQIPVRDGLRATVEHFRRLLQPASDRSAALERELAGASLR